METLQLTNMKLTWLSGGVNNLDGGAMFGVVPKPLWMKKYPCNENNQVELRADPILVQINGKNMIIDTGLGNGKFTEKQLRNFGVKEESHIVESLQDLSLTVNDIDYVLMTHLHYDHANGLTKLEGEQFVSVFPKAKIVVNQIEWDEMRQPNIRSKNTYWKENWEAIQNQVVVFDKEWQLDGIRMIHTGGHSNGHCIIVMEDQEQMIFHMADLMPTHSHNNVLWVMAYDDYPMDSIAAKQKWLEAGITEKAWFTFYHDAYYRAVKLDEKGNIIESIKKTSLSVS